MGRCALTSLVRCRRSCSWPSKLAWVHPGDVSHLRRNGIAAFCVNQTLKEVARAMRWIHGGSRPDALDVLNLLSLQGFWVNEAISKAYRGGDDADDEMVDWLLHMDPDELFHPENVSIEADTESAFRNGTSVDYSLHAADSHLKYFSSGMSIVDTLRRADDDLCMINFLNYEGLPEKENIQKGFRR